MVLTDVRTDVKTVVSIVGTRPQFLKLAPLAKLLDDDNMINHIIIHTGQHYDNNLSTDHFNTLMIKKPDYFLNINNLTFGSLLGTMIMKIEELLIKIKPDYVLVFGDCNTTLAGGLATNKLGFKLIHIESGLRSYNKNMPEEINRVLVDYMADIRFCPDQNSVDNLKKESIYDNIHIIGQLQIDLLKHNLKNYNNDKILKNNNLISGNYILLTIHRHYNTNKKIIKEIFNQCEKINCNIFFPIHPRTRKVIDKFKIFIPKNFILHDPVNYMDMTILERFSKMIITDSGGIQTEAHYLGKPCLTIRSETEWIETLISGQNQLVNPCDIYTSYINTIKWDFKEDLNYSYNLNCAKEIVKILKNNII